MFDSQRILNSMPWTSKHLNWLSKKGNSLTTSDKKPIEIWEFQHKADDQILSAWAKHFRNHYCLDSEIDSLRSGLNFSRKQYLNHCKFPDKSKAPGPSIRAGDFGEILVADYLEYILGYNVYHTRYCAKTIRNESTKGCDTLAFKIIKEGAEDPRDTLAIFETKTQFSGTKPKKLLQNAVDGSSKDHLRKAESLNAIKQRLLDKGQTLDVQKVERFQNLADHPYKEVFGAAAIFATQLYDASSITKTSSINHPKTGNLQLLVIYGDDMMKLVHDLYRRAASEA